MNANKYVFGENLKLYSNSGLCNNAISDMFNGFTFRSCKLIQAPIESMAAYTDKSLLPTLPKEKSYRVTVSENGIGIVAKDYKSLARAFIALISKIEQNTYENGNYTFKINTCDFCDSYSHEIRMIHFCVFPETKLSYLHRLIRLAALCQYTHICIEFWGMLEFDFCKAMSWENAYTKAQIKPIIGEIYELGAEPVPMLNSLGHASYCRVSSGKHVVLDRFPEYAHLFTPDGWAYNISNPETLEFLKNARAELNELFEKPQYFHLGCDESYQKSKEYYKGSYNFIKKLCTSVLENGQTPIIWGDSLLYKGQYDAKEYCCFALNKEIADFGLSVIPKETVIADWQYDVASKTVLSSQFLTEKGFKVLGSPWYKESNMDAYMATDGLYGIMVTTWHTLGAALPSIVSHAAKMGAVLPDFCGKSQLQAEAAALMRRAGEGVEADYGTYGFVSKQAELFV